MNPASKIIRLFGGHARLARELCVDLSTVYRWTYKNGTAGAIPRRYHAAILRRAKRRGIALAKADLI